jgi:hypothetical protein
MHRPTLFLVSLARIDLSPILRPSLLCFLIPLLSTSILPRTSHLAYHLLCSRLAAMCLQPPVQAPVSPPLHWLASLNSLRSRSPRPRQCRTSTLLSLPRPVVAPPLRPANTNRCASPGSRSSRNSSLLPLQTIINPPHPQPSTKPCRSP